jgi:hypothetical protein
MVTLLLPRLARVVNINEAAGSLRLFMGWGVGREAMQGLGKSLGSLLKRTYETFLYTENVLKTGLYGIFQSHP